MNRASSAKRTKPGRVRKRVRERWRVWGEESNSLKTAPFALTRSLSPSVVFCVCSRQVSAKKFNLCRAVLCSFSTSLSSPLFPFLLLFFPPSAAYSNWALAAFFMLCSFLWLFFLLLVIYLQGPATCTDTDTYMYLDIFVHL